MLDFAIWWLAVVRSENISHVDPDESTLLERIENLRIQVIELLNNTDAYEVPTTISDNVAETLKLFDDLGAVLKNGTAATYMCVVDDGYAQREFCDIYALPNGSKPLKKSIVKLLLDGYNTTELVYGDLGDMFVEKELVRKWFPPRSTGAWSRDRLVDDFVQDIIRKFWWDYRKLVTVTGPHLLEPSTWQNETGRNLSKCLPDFLIRYNNYDEAAYKTFVRDISTIIYHELTFVAFCLGISQGNDAENRLRDRARGRLPEQVREIMKQILDARSVLSEEPPTTAATTTTTRRTSTEPQTSDPLKQALADQIENRTVQAIKLLNDTDAYEMATQISATVADTLKFFDELGPFFRNGTIAKYMCMEDGDSQERCDIYALPNGSVPLKKSVVKLMFCVFYATKQKYSNPRSVVINWFPTRATESRNEIRFRVSFVNSLHSDFIQKIWTTYDYFLLGYEGLRYLDKSTWQNNTGRNLTTWKDFNGFRTFLLGITCTRSGLSRVIPQVLYGLMGPHCANESDMYQVSEFQSIMREFASLGNFNGGDSNRCLPNFLIRYNNYDEAVYKTFVKDISTFIYHEITMTGFCLGIIRVNDDEKGWYEQRRDTLSGQVREIMKQLFDARTVLNEEPPTKPTEITLPELPSSEAVKTEVTNALRNAGGDFASLPWKERPDIYGRAAHDVVQKLKFGYNSSENASVNGVLYLPYETGHRGLHCAHVVDNGSYSGTVAGKANYFVKYTQNAADAHTLKEKFEALEANEDRILKSVFAKGHDDMCRSVSSALQSQRSKRNGRQNLSDAMGGMGFSAFVAVKCAYDFVWYELGWRYFTAARTTSDYALEKNGGTFDAECGQLIFLR